MTYSSSSAPGGKVAADNAQYTQAFGVPIKSVMMHRAKLTGLACGTFYTYSVGDGTADSPSLNFTTAPPVGPAAYPVRFIAYADMGISNSENTAAMVSDFVNAGKASFVIHAGDIAYADNRASIRNGTEYEDVLNQFYTEVSPYSQVVPYISSSGNHEILGPAPGFATPNFLAYRSRMSPTLPWKAAGGSEFWYSWTHGPITFVAFDIDQPYDAGSPQHAWLSTTLAGINRAVTPWVVAYSHFPMYCSNFFWCCTSPDCSTGDSATFRRIYEPLFTAPESRVDVFISGHVHAAELIKPVQNFIVTDPSAPFDNVQSTIHLMTGFPGDVEVCCNQWMHPIPSWSAWRDDDVASDGGNFGFSHWTILNNTHLHLTMFDSTNRTVLLEQTVSRVPPAALTA